MIALRNNLPLLEDHFGAVRAFERDWLLAALERAAIKAGFGEWWLADHVLSSVCIYLGTAYAKNVVRLSRLQDAVRRALHDIGYVEIAHCFEAEFPASHISLLRCLQNLDTVDFESFRRVISLRLEELHQGSLTHFHLFELGSCVQLLNSSGKKSIEVTAANVVDTLREKIASLKWDRDITCSIS